MLGYGEMGEVTLLADAGSAGGDGVSAERCGDDMEFWYRVRMPGPGLTGEMSLILESQLYIAPGGFGRRAHLYPVTIVQVRYSGTYEGPGGDWIAFPVDTETLVTAEWEDWSGSDSECADWWARAAAQSWCIGRGRNPLQAHEDLLNQVCAAAGVERSELEAVPSDGDGDRGGAQARRLMQLELTMRGKRDWLAWRLCNWVLRWIGTDWYETRMYQLVSLGILYAEEEKERSEREAAAAGDGS